MVTMTTVFKTHPNFVGHFHKISQELRYFMVRLPFCFLNFCFSTLAVHAVANNAFASMDATVEGRPACVLPPVGDQRVG
jgi:hypothetical protein